MQILAYKFSFGCGKSKNRCGKKRTCILPENATLQI